jgi:hypothetical protein
LIFSFKCDDLSIDIGLLEKLFKLVRKMG